MLLEIRYKNTEFVSENRDQIFNRVKDDPKPYCVKTVEENQLLFGVEMIQRESKRAVRKYLKDCIGLYGPRNANQHPFLDTPRTWI